MCTISEFLEISPISLHYRAPRSDLYPWVFWSKNEGSENNSSTITTDLGTLKIHDKIISVFSDIELGTGFGQLWVPVTIGGRQLLSTSGQPFAVWHHLSSNEGDHMIKSGGPAIAFLSRLPYIYPRVLPEDCGDKILNFSIVLPICFPSQSSCIGVLEFTFYYGLGGLGTFVLDTIRAVKNAGLDVFHVQDFIPYTTIYGLKLAKDEIKEALKVVCESHNLDLAQAWIAFENRSHVPLSSLEDTKTNRFLAIKLTGYLNHVSEDEDDDDFDEYFRVCDDLPCAIWSGAPAEVELPLQTLQDYGSYYIHALRPSMLIDWEARSSITSALAICLRSNDTGDFNYALEFIWTAQSNYVKHLEAIILTLKRCLPKFKFASCTELGDELDVIVAHSATQSENDKIGESETFKIFQGKTLPSSMPKAPEEGNNYIAPSKVACETAAKVLPQEETEKQFGKTLKEAEKNLIVPLSTFESYFNGLGMQEWPGPNFLKRKPNDSSIVEIDTNEEDNGVIKEPSTIIIDQKTLTIKTPMPKAPEEGKNDIAPSKVACKTAAKVLPREVIEKQFGKTMKEAAKNLNVSLSTLKRKFKGLGIPEWPGPNFLKRKANDSSIVQIDTDEEENGAIQEPSTIIIDQDSLTIKAELLDDMIKFDLPISQATFVTIEKEIGMKWELSVGTYKLKYLDEEGDWILLRSDAEMRDCIKSLRISNRTAIKIRVLPSPQPISGPSGSFSILSI